MTKETLISQAMIVKNEEKNIERALSWGKDIMMERIVVDTGSTDRTVDVAVTMGAKVYHFDWIDDFSAAKNFAVEKCSGDWIAFLDADEYITDDVKKISRIIEEAEKDGCSVIAAQLLNINDEGKIIGSMTQARFFKNHVGICYQGRIHEHLSSKEPVKIYDGTTELHIFHTGYSESAHKEKNKDEKYKVLLEKEIEDKPYNADNYGYLGDIYAGESEFEKAEELYFKAMKLMSTEVSGESGRRGNTLRNLLLILGGYNYRTEELLQVYRLACSILPQDADFPCMAGEHFYRYRNYQEAKKYYKCALETYERFGAYLKSDYVDSHLIEIHSKLANSYYQCEEYLAAIKVSLIVLKADKYNAELMRILLLCIDRLDKSGTAGYGLKEETELLCRLYDFGSLRDKAFIYVIAKKLELQGLTGYIRSISSDTEMKVME
ncbi:tetratricopeptide repeat-containing glycosyltransferase family 2 protein [Oribacterium sp. WCC10]|uniref:tetratricopeptide repeat-containing glycosyltransferase family 2 protein n=1 Tax=Oribacterium sp. WCC10 TaxID=1855343 RepID=UPI0008EDA390|nr:glycosyltransferase family 2 protein [Oribacterium sp. WCC10]SFG24215.1 Glycosyl transferase family 2 [Oribacterium sp. WCC10]